ncbi:MAG: type II toxin-antitoxin system VapC family toxin [Tildeniella nuda ZEHNDER 1965/U140]|jgi:predicted nucleic acid-binding protein|nr:type II toxin-antitoxin system VapC family toxin [Tildeniella nuda ZEHNDER 1965/U140]
MSPIRVFFDTNVLVYAHDQASVYHSDAASLLETAFQQGVQGIIAEQTIVELYRVLTNPVAMTGSPLTPSQANQLIAGTYLSGTFEILYPTLATIKKTLELAVSRQITSAKIFDLRLSALASEAAIDYFATYNMRDFQGISDLPTMLPHDVLAIIQP